MQTRPFLASCLAVLALSASAQAAGPLYEQARQAQGQAPGFQIGRDVYQVVPDAVAVRRVDPSSDAGLPPASSRTPAGASQAIGRVGPYDILPTSAAGLPARHGAAAKHDGYTVVMNLRTGQAALLPPRLVLYPETSGQGAALAAAVGGRLAYDGQAMRATILEFDSVEAALRALPLAASQPGVREAQPLLIHGAPQPR